MNPAHFRWCGLTHLELMSSPSAEWWFCGTLPLVHRERRDEWGLPAEAFLVEGQGPTVFVGDMFEFVDGQRLAELRELAQTRHPSFEAIVAAGWRVDRVSRRIEAGGARVRCRQRARYAALQELECRYVVAILLQRILERVGARIPVAIVLQVIREGGGRLVNEVVEGLELDPSAVGPFVRVRERISLREFYRIARLVSPRGKALSWSHFEVLACEPDRWRRRQLAVAASRESLSVGELEARRLRSPGVVQ
jgi:hypothetical protein